MRLTLPSASDEIVTWSTAASVPTSSTARFTVSWRTVSVATPFAAASRPRACAVSVLEQPAAQVAAARTRKQIDRIYVCEPYLTETLEVYDVAGVGRRL